MGDRSNRKTSPCPTQDINEPPPVGYPQELRPCGWLGASPLQQGDFCTSNRVNRFHDCLYYLAPVQEKASQRSSSSTPILIYPLIPSSNGARRASRCLHGLLCRQMTICQSNANLRHSTYLLQKISSGSLRIGDKFQ
jgi:hypothetical protein